jgi:hypothetical protein
MSGLSEGQMVCAQCGATFEVVIHQVVEQHEHVDSLPSLLPSNVARVTAPGVRILCLDGPLEGAQTTVASEQSEVVLHAPDGTEVRYRIEGLVSEFPGSLYAARVVTA